MWRQGSLLGSGLRSDSDRGLDNRHWLWLSGLCIDDGDRCDLLRLRGLRLDDSLDLFNLSGGLLNLLGFLGGDEVVGLNEGALGFLDLFEEVELLGHVYIQRHEPILLFDDEGLCGGLLPRLKRVIHSK